MENPADSSGAADLRLLAASVQDFALFTTDADRRVRHWNAGAERLFGWTADEARGRTADLVFTPEDRADGAPDQEVEAARRDGRAQDERWHLRKDGTRFWGSGVMVALRGASGELLGFGKVLHDLTAREQAAEELRATAAALAWANEQLENTRGALTTRVEERTAELARANAELRDESEARARSAAERRRLLGRLVTAQEEERRHISRELHDNTGQHLTALALGLRALRVALSAGASAGAAGGAGAAVPDVPEVVTLLDEMDALASELSRGMHRLAVDLRPTALDDLGLVAALGNYVEEWSARTGIPSEFQTVGLERAIPGPAAITAYRVVIEALTNVARHAADRGATRVQVTLQRRGGYLQAVIEDDGPGFDPEEVAARPDRLGLVGMRERAALLGGTLEVESSPGAGATVFLRVPLRPDPDPEAGAGGDPVSAAPRPGS